MSAFMDVNIISYALSGADWAGDDVNGRILQAPAADAGGGITILWAEFVNEAATTAGTAFALELVNYGTSGTVLGGTVDSIGGTADVFVAGLPKAFDDAAGYHLAAGEWLVLNKTETNSSDPTRGVLSIGYIMGK